MAAIDMKELPQAGVLTIGELARTIKRNAIVFWVTLIVGLAIGVVVSLLMPPAYAATTQILVEAPGSNGATITPDVVIGEISVPAAAYNLETQIQLLQSQKVYFAVLQEAGIPIPTTQVQYDALPQISIRQQGESNVFGVVVEGTNTDQVKQIAGLYPTVFRSYLDGQKKDTIERALQFVQNRLASEREAQATAEDALAKFKADNKVVDSQAELSRRINETSSGDQILAGATQNYEQNQAAVRSLEQELANLPATRKVTQVRTNNETLLQNKDKLANLQVQRAQLAEIYQESAPQVREIDAQIKQQKQVIEDLQKTIDTNTTETNPLVDAVKSQLITAKSNAQASAASLAAAQQTAEERRQRLNELGGLVKTQHDLEQRITIHSNAIDRLTQVEDAFQLRDNSLSSGVSNLTPTQLPQQVRPNWVVNMTLATLLSIALAVVLVLTRDSIQDKVNTDEEAYALSHIDILTRIPERPRGRSALISDPQSSTAFESYRVLRSLIGFASSEAPIHSLLVTSTGKGEGKTVVASNLAVAFALNGQDVILVDANFRSPGVHSLFGKPERPGLGEVLLGQADLESVIVDTPVPGLRIVPAGTVPANATEALGSDRMSDVVKRLKGLSQMVVFDTPATLGIADAPSLAPHADSSIIVLQEGKPGKAEFSDAVSLLKASSPHVLGLVLNRVRAKQARLENV